MTTTLLTVDAVTVTRESRGRLRRRASLPVLEDVSLAVDHGEILGLVGESGSGKSTLARTVVGLHRPVRGTVRLDGVDVHGATGADRRRMRRAVQLVFQDPLGSLPAHRSVGATVAEALVIHAIGDRRDRPGRVADLLALVGLAPEVAGRRPGELSGGQVQRVAIARVLAVQPQLLICDESVSALDTVVQATILGLLADLRTRLGIGCLFIAHDLAVVARVADRIAVLDAGRVVESGPTASVFGAPTHHVTRQLLAAVPRLPG